MTEKIDKMEHEAFKDSNFNETLSDVITLEKDTTKKVRKNIINYGGIIMGVFIVFVAITALTTDIKLDSFMDWAALGLSFFILTFCSYGMYISCADTGTRAGKVSDPYIKAIAKYEGLKDEVVKNRMQMRLSEFCKWFRDEELKNTRTTILTEVGLDYEAYIDNWCGKDKKFIMGLNLSEVQKAAVLDANRVKPIHLSSDRMFKRGRGQGSRDPLGMTPEKKKTLVFSTKFLRIVCTSTLMSMIAFDVIAEPTWAVFAQVMVKVMMIILNGFYGYKFGFENISYDTANYINDQSLLMEQFIEYVQLHPVIEEKI